MVRSPPRQGLPDRRGEHRRWARRPVPRAGDRPRRRRLGAALARAYGGLDVTVATEPGEFIAKHVAALLAEVVTVEDRGGGHAVRRGRRRLEHCERVASSTRSRSTPIVCRAADAAPTASYTSPGTSTRATICSRPSVALPEVHEGDVLAIPNVGALQPVDGEQPLLAAAGARWCRSATGRRRPSASDGLQVGRRRRSAGAARDSGPGSTHDEPRAAAVAVLDVRRAAVQIREPSDERQADARRRRARSRPARNGSKIVGLELVGHPRPLVLDDELHAARLLVETSTWIGVPGDVCRAALFSRFSMIRSVIVGVDVDEDVRAVDPHRVAGQGRELAGEPLGDRIDVRRLALRLELARDRAGPGRAGPRRGGRPSRPPARSRRRGRSSPCR